MNQYTFSKYQQQIIMQDMQRELEVEDKLLNASLGICSALGDIADAVEFVNIEDSIPDTETINSIGMLFLNIANAYTCNDLLLPEKPVDQAYNFMVLSYDKPDGTGCHDIEGDFTKNPNLTLKDLVMKLCIYASNFVNVLMYKQAHLKTYESEDIYLITVDNYFVNTVRLSSQILHLLKTDLKEALAYTLITLHKEQLRAI